MQEITLHAAGWTTREDFYAAYLPAVGAPDWHGHNLDALWDSLIGGDINAVNPPFRVRFIGTANLPADCQRVLEGFAEIVADARDQGIPIEAIFE
jgi:RNAse (barnase) inhibitor barstar